MRTLLRSWMCCLTLALVATSAAAQERPLDDTWFKVSAKLKGAGVSEGNVAEKTAGSVTFYLFFADTIVASVGGDPNFPGVDYEVLVVSEVAPGEFGVTGFTTLVASGEDHEVLTAPTLTGPAGIAVDIIVPDEDSTELTITFQAQAKVKVDGRGGLKKASFKSVAAMVAGQGGGELIVGAAKLKAASVDVAKLPFDPGTLEE